MIHGIPVIHTNFIKCASVYSTCNSTGLKFDLAVWPWPLTALDSEGPDLYPQPTRQVWSKADKKTAPSHRRDEQTSKPNKNHRELQTEKRIWSGVASWLSWVDVRLHHRNKMSPRSVRSSKESIVSASPPLGGFVPGEKQCHPSSSHFPLSLSPPLFLAFAQIKVKAVPTHTNHPHTHTNLRSTHKLQTERKHQHGKTHSRVSMSGTFSMQRFLRP